MPVKKVRRAIVDMKSKRVADFVSAVSAILARGLNSLIAFLVGLVIGLAWIYLALALITILASL